MLVTWNQNAKLKTVDHWHIKYMSNSSFTENVLKMSKESNAYFIFD